MLEVCLNRCHCPLFPLHRCALIRITMPKNMTVIFELYFAFPVCHFFYHVFIMRHVILVLCPFYMVTLCFFLSSSSTSFAFFSRPKPHPSHPIPTGTRNVVPNIQSTSSSMIVKWCYLILPVLLSGTCVHLLPHPVSPAPLYPIPLPQACYYFLLYFKIVNR